MSVKTFAHCTPRKTVSGSGGAVSCKTCKVCALDTEKTLLNGLKLIRLRFDLGRGELPFLSPSGLKCYLLSLLGGKEVTLFSLGSPVCRFPRVQTGYDHEGFPIWKRLSRRHRWELAHSCSSLVRSLPDGCPYHVPSKVDAWLKTATSPPPPPSSQSDHSAYLCFVRKTVSRLFPLGWDRERYVSSVHSFAPKLSARAETREWGHRASDWWADFAPDGQSSKHHFTRLALHGQADPLCSPPFAAMELTDNRFHLRVKTIPTAGKSRVIGIPSMSYDMLGPLHRTIYGHLVSLRDSPFVHGRVDVKRVKGVCRGTVQTSVDLVNATDGLRLDVTEAILGKLLSKAVSVPGQIKVWAMMALYPAINAGSMGEVAHGQMMGTYLSFPLLCLHSYLAASWAARNSGLRGIMVNGDDVVTSTDSPLGEYPSGYELNRSKTMTAENACELNSTVFLRDGKGWKEVRNLRRGGGLSDFHGFRHMASACVNAGPAWVTAFIKAGFGKRWGLGAAALGLPLSHHLVYHREVRFFGTASTIREPSPRLSTRYLLTDVEPSNIEKIAFGIDLFDNGRDSQELDVFNPSRSACLKRCPRADPRIRLAWSRDRARGGFKFMPSYDSILREPKGEKKRTWMTLSPSSGMWQVPEEDEEEESRIAVEHRLCAREPRAVYRPDFSQLYPVYPQISGLRFLP